MDLFALSGSSVLTVAAREAVGTWAAQRQFRGVDNDRFAVSWALGAVA